MKKSILLRLVLVSVIFSACGGIKGLMTYKTDPSLAGIKNIHVLPIMNSVGFEWDKITNHEIHGINIYRGNASGDKGSFKRIGTVGNRYATHFVDRHVKADHKYSYRFTTFSLGRESRRSPVLYVKTRPPFSAVSFVKVYKVENRVAKILWKPHADHSVNTYIVQRSVDGGKWKFVSQVHGRLMAEYIDTFVRSGHSYRYRIIAQSYDKIEAKPSYATKLRL